MPVLRSRDNARVRRWSKLVRDARLRRREARTLLEGAHLVSAYLERGGAPIAMLVTEEGLARAEIAQLVARASVLPVVLSDGLFRAVVDVESPAGLAAEIAIPASRSGPGGAASCVFLEGIQDAGNVGAILRSAAAFGVPAAVLERGCADPWSPKALRAGQGGQFGIEIFETADLGAALDAFAGTLVCTVPRGGAPLAELELGGRIGWLFGAEGQGLSPETAARAALRATIPMAGGIESLNVAAAAAICLYEQARQLSRPAARC